MNSAQRTIINGSFSPCGKKFTPKRNQFLHLPKNINKNHHKIHLKCSNPKKKVTYTNHMVSKFKPDNNNP